MGRQQELIFDQRRLRLCAQCPLGAGLGCPEETGHSISPFSTRVSEASPDDCGLFLWLPRTWLILGVLQLSTE